MSKKNKMIAFKINEISAVDRPAQEHARMLIMKRDEPKPKETVMKLTAEQQAAQDEAIAKAVADAVKKTNDEAKAKADAEIAVAKKFGEFNDAEKAHYNSLDEAGKKDFMLKSAEQRKDVIAAEIAKAADKDPVVYKANDGTEYRKSAGDNMIALAKRADEAEKIAKSEREIREGNELKKRATELFPNMAGTPEVKAALLKSIEGIADETTRKAALESAKAGDAALKAAFNSVGNSRSVADGSAQDNFDKGLAKFQADQKLTSVAKATQEFLKTAEGTALYEATQVTAN